MKQPKTSVVDESWKSARPPERYVKVPEGFSLADRVEFIPSEQPGDDYDFPARWEPKE